MSIVTVKQLLETGVHFGHQTSNWDPKMDPYIFTSRNKVHIIDLEKTEEKIKEAYNFVRDTVAEGKDVLFVCTKRQGNDIITEEAKRCSMYYINYRWWGGMLTNFATISKSIDRLKELEQMQEDGILDSLSKKEQSRLMKEKYRLERALIGIKDMKDLPGVLYIVDTNLEEIAVSEARKLNIPIVALVDTNCNPEVIDYVIPGNDDALRSIKLVTSVISDAVLEGLDMRVRSVKEDDNSAKRKKNDNSLSSVSEANDTEKVKPVKGRTSKMSDGRLRPASKGVKGKEKESEPDRPDTEVKGADGGGDDGLQGGAVKE